ncbi:MAG: ATP synthase F0 subunit A [Zetaproteobacteria bacterium]|nr:ATP synthase F0 subunit A [Pseudobdellovibrionaceae bacterium]
MLNKKFFILASVFFGANAHAGAGGGPINYFAALAGFVGLDVEFSPLFASAFVLCLLFSLGAFYSREVRRVVEKGDVAPQPRFSLFVALDSVMEFLFSFVKEQLGRGYQRYLPLLCGLFLFILCSNLTGLIPGFPPATESFGVNLVLGLVVFARYHAAGVAEHGFSYVKQFTGPFLSLAPLFVVIELISHAARPASLAFRLTANIFADHLIVGVFSGIIPLVFPSMLMFFGLLVACVQSFVFTMLTCIYISMAVSHDH